MILEIVIFAVILLLIFVRRNQKPKGLPPGEWGYPLIGFLPFGEKVIHMVDRMRKQYGDIFVVKLGSRPVIFLCDFDMVKSTFSKTITAGRPDFFSLTIFSKVKNNGIVMSYGHVWNSNRRFALRVLRDFGLGKSSLEDTINIETEYFVEHLKKQVGKPVKISWAMNVAALNVAWGLIAGRRFDMNDLRMQEFSRLLSEDLSTREGPMLLLDFFPAIVPYVPRFIKDNWMKVSKIEHNRDLLKDFLLDIINDCEKTLDPDSPRHYIDMYIIERERLKDDPMFDFRKGNDDLYTSLSDLFVAGSDTTSQTVKWMFLYLAKYQEVQKKIHKEIDSVVPKSRHPQFEDKANLPYLEATIHDLQRIISLLPTGVPHECTEDLEINGYHIPKGTVLNACIHAIHRDKKYWARPDELYPEHFLDNEGKFKLQTQGFMPFSQGRRICLGESLAKMELFLFISAVLQNFEITVPEGSSISLEPNPIVNIFNTPVDQDLILTNRK